MSAPEPQIDVEQWIEYCERLSATQNFLLLGLLSRSPFTSLSILQAQPLETQENWDAAREWILKHLRDGLKLYCDNYKKYQIEVSVEVGKTFGKIARDFIGNVAPAIAYATAGVKGLGITFVVWLLRYSMDKWCSKYSNVKYSGKGDYYRLIPKSAFGAFFDVTYTPPILVYSEDQDAFPLNISKRQVKVPAQTSGLIRVADKKAVDDIYSSLRADKNHSFQFKDVTTEQFVRGTIDFVLPAPEIGAYVLKLGAEELNVSKS